MRPPETNIAICGHSKHGKSTVAGRLLFELGSVTEHEINRAKADVPRLGRDFNEFSLMFLKNRTDTFGKEKGLPEDPSRTVFPERGRVTLEDGRLLSLIDTPGHMVFLENIIYGIHLSDLAVLVVEATDGVQNGTVEVARILGSFSVPLVAVLITKMDEVGFAQAAYEKVSSAVTNLLAAIPNFRVSRLGPPSIIPVSALSGEGIREHGGAMEWYTGPTAMEAISQAQTEASPANVRSVRFAVEGTKEVYSPPGVGTVLVGGLEAGELKPGMDLVVEPTSTRQGARIVLKVRSVQRARALNEKKSAMEDAVSARAVASVAVAHLPLQQAHQVFRHGAVLGPVSAPPCVAKEIWAEVLFFAPDTVYLGRNYGVSTNALDGAVKIVELEEQGAPSGLERRFRPQVGHGVRARLRFENPMCIETSPDFHRFTLFVLRDHNSVVGCGRCTDIIE